MLEAVALALFLSLSAPYALSQSNLRPRSGIALWLAILILRASVALSLVLVVVFFLPATELFSLLTHWCLHAVIPFFATHLGFDGHRLGDAALLVPALILAASLLSVTFAAWRAARAVRGWLRRDTLGPGPEHSVIVVGSEVVVAAAGLRDPRVVVSAGALLHLDDDELAAGLQHEWGHVRHRHRFIVLAGQVCAGVSRLLPGGRRALASLLFHLEREADEYSVRQTGDPLALASAICKAAGVGGHHPSPALAGLGDSGVTQRVRLLAQGPGRHGGRGTSQVARGLTAAAVALTLTLVAAMPAVARAGIDQLDRAPVDRAACE